MKIDLMILAAGYSRRFQGNKLLYPYAGKPLIQHTFDQIDPALFHRIIVVTQYPKVMQLAQTYHFSCVYNEDPSRGISSSILCGMHALTKSEAILFLVADQPHIRKQTLAKMVQLANPQQIISAYDQEIKNPMLFPKRYFPQLQTLTGDHGAKKIALQHIDQVLCVSCIQQELQDIDQREDI